MSTNTNTHRANNAIFHWQASAQVHHGVRTLWWYVMATLIIGGCVAYSVLTNAWSFLLIIVASGVAYALVHHREPPLHEIALYDDGVEFDGIFMPWNNFSGFWVLIGRDYSELHLERSGYQQNLKIQTAATDPYAIRAFLLSHLPEHVHRNERFIDIIIRICKI